MGLADQVIAVSDAVATAMHQRGLPRHKLTAIRNATIGSPRQRPPTVLRAFAASAPAITTSGRADSS